MRMSANNTAWRPWLRWNAPISFRCQKSEAWMNLYWCETSDHEEDWFIVAPSAKEACRLHETVEGYDEGDAHATFLRRIPREAHAVPGWPDHTLLRTLGAIFLSETTPR